MTADPVVLEACRLLGLDRPRKRATDNDLAVEAEYRIRAAREYLAGEANDQLRAYHAAALESINVEIGRRLAAGAPRRGKGMTRADVDRIRDAVGCHEYLQWLGVDMRPAGRERWMGRCFAHEDRTPSLSVTRLFFHCFSCGIGGDVFDLPLLVLNAERMSMTGLRLRGTGGDAQFRDAVRVLADFAGLPDPTMPPKVERPLVRGVTF